MGETIGAKLGLSLGLLVGTTDGSTVGKNEGSDELTIAKIHSFVIVTQTKRFIRPAVGVVVGTLDNFEQTNIQSRSRFEHGHTLLVMSLGL